MRPTPQVVVLSGPIASGKSTLADGLSKARNAAVVASRWVLVRSLGTAVGRDQLIVVGDELDRATSGGWIADTLIELVAVAPIETRTSDMFVVDAIRRSMQIDRIRERFQSVVHVHLVAEELELARRYAARGETMAFTDARAGDTERAVSLLAASSDLVVDTGLLGPAEVLRLTLDELDARGYGERPPP